MIDPASVRETVLDRDRAHPERREVVELTFLLLRDHLEALEGLAAADGISVGVLLRRLVQARLTERPTD